MFVELCQFFLADWILSVKIGHIFLRLVAHPRRIAPVGVALDFSLLPAQHFQNMTEKIQTVINSLERNSMNLNRWHTRLESVTRENLYMPPRGFPAWPNPCPARCRKSSRPGSPTVWDFCKQGHFNGRVDSLKPSTYVSTRPVIWAGRTRAAAVTPFRAAFISESLSTSTSLNASMPLIATTRLWTPKWIYRKDSKWFVTETIPFCLFTLVFRSIFRRFLNLAGTSSTSASSWELLEPMVSIPSGRTFNVDSSFFRTEDLFRSTKYVTRLRL